MHRYKTVLVLGSGRSGRAAEALLRSEGTSVTTLSEEGTPDYCFEILPVHPDAAIVSPGFSLEHPWVTDLQARGIPLLSEIELGWSRRRCPVIAVTGSNGKSTVVKWLVEALAYAGKTAVPCGNYGFPVSAAVMTPETPDFLVMEVSSFQLETVQAFRPDVGVLLNLLPNHLDRHGSMDEYLKMKLRLFEQMEECDTAIVPYELFQTLKGELGGGSRPNLWKTFGAEPGADLRYEDGRVGPVDLSGTRFANAILGPAAAAVTAVIKALGLPLDAVSASARSFKPLAHRMETVAEIGGVRFVDDSKATNVAAMCAALQMCEGRVHLIAGGRSKESDLNFAKDLLVERVAQLYLIGEASAAMQAAWGEAVHCIPCETLQCAVTTAWKQARSGETVLLSPACASFDQFQSFNERGEVFAQIVRSLKPADVSV